MSVEELHRIEGQLSSKVPAVRAAGAKSLARLLACQKSIRDNPQLAALIRTLTASSTATVSGKMQQKQFSDEDSKMRRNMQKALDSLPATVRQETQRALRDANLYLVRTEEKNAEQ